MGLPRPTLTSCADTLHFFGKSFGVILATLSVSFMRLVAVRLQKRLFAHSCNLHPALLQRQADILRLGHGVSKGGGHLLHKLKKLDFLLYASHEPAV